MHDLATLFARHIKDLLVRKLIQTGHSDLLKKLDGYGLIKMCSTTSLFQNNTKLFQNSLSKQTILT